MKRVIQYTTIAGMLLACSCDKHNVLLTERARVEAEIKRAQDDLSAIDQKMMSLGMDVVIAQNRLTAQNSEGKRKNEQLEQELVRLTNKCSEGEAAVKALRGRLDSYKAKYLR